MRVLTTIAGGCCAIALLTGATAAAQPVPDPMAALQRAAPLDALHSVHATSEAEAAAPAVPDPMAAAADPQTGAATQTAAVQGEPNPELGDLPDGPGAEETYYQCVACHSTAIIRQQQVTDARWDYLWQWMVDAQGMVEPDAETKGVILAYLKQHFSSER